MSTQLSYSCSVSPVTSDSASPWTVARQASLSFTTSWSLLSLKSIESVMPSNHLMLCRPLLLLPSIFPSIRAFPMSQLFTSGSQSIRASASASFPSREYSGLIPFRIDWFELLERSKGLSRVFSSTTVRKHQFFSESLTDTDL